MTPSPPKEPFEAEGLISGNLRINGIVYEPDQALRIFHNRKAYIHDLLSRTWDNRLSELEKIGLPPYIPSAYSKKKI